MKEKTNITLIGNLLFKNIAKEDRKNVISKLKEVPDSSDIYIFDDYKDSCKVTIDIDIAKIDKIKDVLFTVEKVCKQLDHLEFISMEFRFTEPSHISFFNE